ncbi:hypothetical protein AKO1_007556 [Acrasis kona]|uniref:Uncharacterized protein n=1 Tax=Acrasis kona TaxID=1008807 RepID=A0AAW2YRC2_9EUKA
MIRQLKNTTSARRLFSTTSLNLQAPHAKIVFPEQQSVKKQETKSEQSDLKEVVEKWDQQYHTKDMKNSRKEMFEKTERTFDN